MPSAPEVRNGIRAVRMIEVQRKMEAQHLSDTDGHIRITAEIVEQLKTVAKSCDPGGKRRHFPEITDSDLCVDCAKGICQDHLFAEALGEDQNAVQEGARLKLSAV